jgi:hypothetical protein
LVLKYFAHIDDILIHGPSTVGIFGFEIINVVPMQVFNERI